jgi:hypothetical protein
MDGVVEGAVLLTQHSPRYRIGIISPGALFRCRAAFRARLNALIRVNVAPRCGARSNRTGLPCRAAVMPNGRWKIHGGKSTGPRTREWLGAQQASKLETWVTFCGKPRRNGRA